MARQATKRIKALNFDIDTKKLAFFHPSKNKTAGYRDIRILMENSGFEHRQGSGYQSVHKMTDTEMFVFAEMLFCTYPWLSDCIDKLDVTNVMQNYDLAEMYRTRPKEYIRSLDNESEIDRQIADALEYLEALNGTNSFSISECNEPNETTPDFEPER